jgi:hydroxymethylpyrimidine pyrophosphatase-like HAD family hydrolase
MQAKGIKVFLCSGRNYYLIRKTGILDIVKPDGLVMMNGACAAIGDVVIYKYPIPADVVNAMIKFSYRLKFGLTLIEESEGHINMIDDRVIDAHAKYGTRFPQPRKFPIPYDRTVYQMIAFCDEFDESSSSPTSKTAKQPAGTNTRSTSCRKTAIRPKAFWRCLNTMAGPKITR